MPQTITNIPPSLRRFCQFLSFGTYHLSPSFPLKNGPLLLTLWASQKAPKPPHFDKCHETSRTKRCRGEFGHILCRFDLEGHWLTFFAGFLEGWIWLWDGFLRGWGSHLKAKFNLPKNLQKMSTNAPPNQTCKECDQILGTSSFVTSPGI